ncbi:hypothetical protein D9M68_266830 [compost metagenome]|uniref:Protein SCO1/2 n=1 Tax=Pseudomonas jinjuensis TaxID=198616 RepID=A0A1G9Z575_9PSED|nr:SCO family protein [Pseudomonas jinjuensis]SDN16377.1 protein SCO1/2 [Pseudomonas jinjuensis]
MNRFPAGIALTFLGLLAFSANGHAHSTGEHGEHAGHSGHMMEEVKHQEASEVSFANVPLLDQRGREIHLKQDLVENRIVVMGFVYTSCTTICPLVSSIMSKVQAELGDRVGTEVQLVSISVDPQRDTPSRLEAYARRYKAGPGWSWVTGTQPNIEETLRALGAWSADYESHPPLIMVGDGNSQHWTRFYGFTDPSVLVAKVRELETLRGFKAAGVTDVSGGAQ